ncbi:hypothetical protein [Haloferula sargassicola]|uniref:PEP-CTERM protein-sorting domain-containing protein n=1 Tax=Haloferula sargassicola TaxID=490096 RepID=A0ABP9UQH8_9BACT
MKLPSLKLTAMGGATLALAPTLHAATILSGTGLEKNLPVPSDHGSNLAGTPDIAVLWSPAGAGGWETYTDDEWTHPSAAADTGSGVYQMDAAITGATYTIQLSPGSGYDVVLTSIDFNVYNGGGDFNIGWTVTGSTSGTLGSGSFLAVTDQNSTLSFGALSGTGGESVSLDLVIGAGSGTGSYLAADNLAFDQVAVPEPGGIVLGALGLGALAMRRRR